jgi:DNA helicase-2/ATP-dependent DNA helicase PcrA
MHDVRAAFDRLNAEQQDAVAHDNDTVVLAGPGSGKTATLVVKVAHLLSNVVPAPRGVACITFNNDAVDEIRMRLAAHGLHSDRRLYLGSVHSFCLNCILRPYARLIDRSLGQHIDVLSEKDAERLLEACATKHVPNVYMPSFGSQAIKMRRAIACDERLSGFGDADLEAVRMYDAELMKRGVVDFEAMVLRSVELVRNHAWIRRLLSSRFPWLVVDEYQDLGGPLHRIVSTLAELANVKVFAVGDPDQTVYGFTGAHPRYLTEFGKRPGVKSVRLRLNYRSGGDLINAGQAALAHPDGPRPYVPAPNRKDRGRILFKKAKDNLADHGRLTVQAVQEAIAEGTEPQEIAILYRGKTELFPDIKDAFDDAHIEYTAERDRTYAKSRVVRWLQQCAGWAISIPSERETLFADLLRVYGGLLADGGTRGGLGRDMHHRSAFRTSLRNVDPDRALGEWLEQMDRSLGLRTALSASRVASKDDRDDLTDLMSEAAAGDFQTHVVRDFADDGRTRGKVVLTTLHASKGRQFDVVVLPGLVEGVMPKRRWNRTARTWEELSEGELRETRRLFYVGFTRARHVVHLIYGDAFVNKGYVNRWGPSRFANEIQERLNAPP